MHNILQDEWKVEKTKHEAKERGSIKMEKKKTQDVDLLSQ